MTAVGVPPATACRDRGMYEKHSHSKHGQLAPFTNGEPGMARLGMVGGPVATIRATAQLRLPNGKLSDLRRTVSALVKQVGPNFDPPFHILRWYDDAEYPAMTAGDLKKWLAIGTGIGIEVGAQDLP